MRVKKVKGGYRVETSVGGYPFGHTYRGFNRKCAILKHNIMETTARKYGSKWIDQPLFAEYC